MDEYLDIIYLINNNFTNFTAIGETLKFGISNYYFEIISILFMLCLLIKQSEMEKNYEELYMQNYKMENCILLLESDINILYNYFSENENCNKIVKDSETGKKRFCKNNPKEDSSYCYLHEIIEDSDSIEIIEDLGENSDETYETYEISNDTDSEEI